MAGRFILALLAALFFAPFSVAQMHVGFRGSARGIPGFRAAFNGHRRHGFPRGNFFGGTPFFSSDYPLESTPEAVPAPFIIQQEPAPAESRPQAKATPLLIELQGDRYVRYGGVTQSPERQLTA